MLRAYIAHVCDVSRSSFPGFIPGPGGRCAFARRSSDAGANPANRQAPARDENEDLSVVYKLAIALVAQAMDFTFKNTG